MPRLRGYIYLVIIIFIVMSSVIMKEFNISMAVAKSTFLGVFLGYIINFIHSRVRKALGLKDDLVESKKELKKTADGKHFIKD